MFAPWKIELLGGLRATQGTQTVTRFRTRKTGGLLAYLAFCRDRACPRDTLVDLLWPDEEIESGRHNLRLALSSLRHQFEPSGTPAGTVLIADRQTARLNPTAVTTDVAEFEAALTVARTAGSETERASALRRAVESYGGNLLPDYTESWVVPQQLRLEDEYVQAVVQLSELLDRGGDAWQALEHVGRAVSIYPLREELHLSLMQLYTASGQVNAARRQYERLAELLQKEWGEMPSKTVQEYAASLRTSAPAIKDASTARRPAIVPATALPVREAAATPTAVPPTPTPMLSLPFSRFFGREEELTTLIEWFTATSPARLVTLIGAGGCGKTRLAQELAGRLRRAYNDSVRFVSLADLKDATLIPGAILESMSVPCPPTRPPLQQVIATLADHPCLLILDNFEQLVEAGADIVQTILERTSAVSCLVTSRQRLNLAGEREWTVLPLPVPTEMDAPASLLEYASVQLFLERARAVKPDFDLTRANARAVAELCQRLDGIPLALELAAARAGVLTPAQMLGHLSTRLLADRPSIFESRQRGTPPRHRTLRAALDWGYNLLSEEQQRFFASLSVFRGGWTAEAAQAVCAGTGNRERGALENSPPSAPCSPFPVPFVFDLLTDLAERSFVQATEADGAMRFTMLETLREYADLQLTESERTTFRNRHRAYFCDLAEQAQVGIREGNPGPWFKRLDRESDNFRAALDTVSEDAAEAQVALRIAAVLWPWWSARGYLAEGRARLAESLSRPGVADATAVRAEALVGAGTLARIQGDPAAARPLQEECLTVSRAVGDQRNAANALYQLGILAIERGDYEPARLLFEESLSLQRAMSDERGVATTLIAFGIATRHRGDYETARALIEESLTIRRRLNDRRGIATCLHNLGAIANEQGDYKTSQEVHEGALAIYQEVGDRRSMATALTCIGMNLKNLGDLTGARNYYEQSLATSREIGDRPNIAVTLVNLGPMVCTMGDFAAARTYLIESLSLAQSLSERRVSAFGLEAFATLAQAEGQFRRAARLFAAADAVRGQIGVPRTPADQERFEPAAASLHTHLGETEYETARAFGSSLTWEQAIAYALSNEE